MIETRSVNRAGKVTKSRSDASGRVLESYDQLDKKSWSEYDSAGNITKSRDPNGVGFDATYDELGRMLTQTDTFGDMTESVYDKEGNVVEQIDAKGNSTFMVYDAQNRRRTVTDRLSGVTTYALNAGGQLTALTDAESQTTSYTYNARGEKTEEQYPDHTSGNPGDATYGKVLFTYDPAGRLSRRDDQNGDTVTHTYDMAGRLLQKDYRTRANSPTGTIADSDTFTYDRSSRMLTAVSGRYSNTVTNTYDVAGRLKDESLTIATKTYTVSRTYDSLGRLFQMTYPNSTVIERTYTDRNQLYTVKYGSNIEDTRTYDDGGRLSTSAYRNGVTTTYNYRDVSGDKDNLLASIQFAHPGGTATNRQVGDLTYTWDANKNKTKETIAGTLSGYSFDTTLGTDPDGYDDEDRITYFKRSNTTNPQTWTLTSVGDWSSWNNFSTTAETRTHGAAHELTRIGSGTTPATILYDTKGNITQNQRTPGTSSTYQNYVWDFDNRMISADTNGDNTADVTFEYDALGRRVARTQGATAVVYIHAGQQTVCDYTRGANANTTPAFRYVWGDYIDEPILRQTGSSTLLYYHHNQQYSTVAITSASGLVVTRFGYTAYGDQTIMSHTGASQTYATYSLRHTYTGREWDDSLKAHYFRARWYDAALGRFVNRDPIGYVDGLSLYRGYFVLQRADPLGMDEFDVTVSFPQDFVTECSNWWNWIITDKTFEVDPTNPNWAELEKYIDAMADDDCIKNIIFNGHGSPGAAGPFTSESISDPTNINAKILAKLGSKMCKDKAKVDLRHCLCANGDKGKRFLIEMSILLNAPVKGITDIYAVNPHGDEYTAWPNGELEKTCVFVPYKETWICRVQSGGGKKGTKPDKPKP